MKDLNSSMDMLTSIQELLTLDFIPQNQKNIILQFKEFLIDKDKAKIGKLRNTLSYILFWNMFTTFDLNKCAKDVNYSFLYLNKILSFNHQKGNIQISLNEANLILLFDNGMFLINEEFNFKDYIDWENLEAKHKSILYKWLNSLLKNVEQQEDEVTNFWKLFYNDWLRDIKNIKNENSTDIIIFEDEKLFDLIEIKDSVRSNIKVIHEKHYMNESVCYIKNSAFYNKETKSFIFWDGWMEKPYSEYKVYGYIKAKNAYKYFKKRSEVVFTLGDTDYRCINIRNCFTKNLYYLKNKMSIDDEFTSLLSDSRNPDNKKQYLIPMNGQWLKYLSTEKINECLVLHEVDNTVIITFTFNRNTDKPIQVKLSYKTENVLKIVLPTLVLWPKFDSAKWKNYYLYTEKNTNNMSIKLAIESKKTYTNIVDKYSINEYSQNPGSYMFLQSELCDEDYGLLLLKWKKPKENKYLKARFYGINIGSLNTAVTYFETENHLVYDRRVTTNKLKFSDLNMFVFKMGSSAKIRLCKRFFPVSELETGNTSVFPTLGFMFPNKRGDISFIGNSCIIFDTKVVLKGTDYKSNELSKFSWKKENFTSYRFYILLLMFLLLAESHFDGFQQSIFNWSFPSMFYDKDIASFKLMVEESTEELREYIPEEKEKYFRYESEFNSLANYFHSKGNIVFDPQSPSIFLNMGVETCEMSLLFENKFFAAETNTGFNQMNEYFSNIKDSYKAFNIKKNYISEALFENDNLDTLLNILFNEMSLSENCQIEKISKRSTKYKIRMKYLFMAFYFYSSVFYFLGLFLAKLLGSCKVPVFDELNIFISGNGSQLLDSYRSIFTDEIKSRLIKDITNESLCAKTKGKPIKINVIESKEPKIDITEGVLLANENTVLDLEKVYFIGETEKWDQEGFLIYKHKEKLLKKKSGLLINHPHFLIETDKLWIKLIQSQIKNDCCMEMNAKSILNKKGNYIAKCQRIIREYLNISIKEDSLFQILNKNMLYPFCDDVWRENNV